MGRVGMVRRAWGGKWPGALAPWAPASVSRSSPQLPLRRSSSSTGGGVPKSRASASASTPPISKWPALFTRNPCAPAMAGLIEARSKDIRGCRIVRPEPLPCRVVDRPGRIPLGVDGAEEAEWLVAVVDPAVRRAGRHVQGIERFPGDDLLGHQGFTSTAQDHDAMHMPC